MPRKKRSKTDRRAIQKNDPEIKHPKHYTRGIECWDYLVSQGMGFLEGNVVKYVTRYKDKNGIKDLYKARAYLEKMIAVAEDPKHRGDAV